MSRSLHVPDLRARPSDEKARRRIRGRPSHFMGRRSWFDFIKNAGAAQHRRSARDRSGQRLPNTIGGAHIDDRHIEPTVSQEFGLIAHASADLENPGAGAKCLLIALVSCSGSHEEIRR